MAQWYAKKRPVRTGRMTPVVRGCAFIVATRDEPGRRTPERHEYADRGEQSRRAIAFECDGPRVDAARFGEPSHVERCETA